MQLRKWLRDGKSVAKSDGEGLTFTLSGSGIASWILRFRHRGRRQEVTLGRYPDLTLSAARSLASKKRLSLIEGLNPADEVRKVRVVKDWTMRELIADYRRLVIPTLADSTQRSYERNLKRVENGMGAMSVATVEPTDIVAQIERVKTGWVELFNLWCVLRALFKHAAGKRILIVSPCNGIQLEAIIGKRPKVKARLMLTNDELKVLLNAKMKPDNRVAIRILAATGVRSAELFMAKREDVYLEEKRWHIPESKTGPAMDIPLADVVVDWFKTMFELGGNSGYVLPARSDSRIKKHGGDAHLSKDALREAIDFWIETHKPAIRRFTPHDLRSTMKSHMRKLGVPRDISEMCLNHKLSGVEGIYDQYTYYDERLAALTKWAEFLSGLLEEENQLLVA
ncbi:site-specific integrase [Herbaspirillum sp. VT-16-41]|uniref:tyrosine-type recombinase/integrase n=1 Tax=Herbaspirillum sp. VT-16-41 TaxID=1953765 RepID=UPI0009D11A62|nr:site-specific integrase [Herbaspirillum sp. VT-16-41]ONN65036.1 integrase [Herbaspirillum sp. VT-16-41]